MAREQTERRQASGELFPTDEPIPASQMIGRRADVAELTVALENGTSVILAGPRRTGKTSVCDAALTRAAGHGIYVAAVDLFELADAAELASALAAAVLRNRPAVRKILPRVRQLGRSALTAAQMALVMKVRAELGEGVELALEPALAARDPEGALRHALELPQRVAVADGKRCIVFFDEFQELAGDRRPYGDPDAVTKRMRAIFQRSGQVSYLFAGSLEHVMRDLFAPQDRAFSGFGSFMTLRPISPDDWRDGIRTRFASDGCTVEEGALARLVELGEGHPRVMMLIAQRIHILCVLLDRRDVDLPLVLQGYDAAYHGDSALLDQLVENIRASSRYGLRMARRVAAGQGLTAGMHRGEADRALKRLIDIGVIERVARGEYAVLNPLLRRRLVEQAQL